MSAPAKAQRTARWATTMTKWLIRHSTSTRPWQVIGFPGPRGYESAGIVDLVAARRNYAPSARGDLLELLFIQVKGGDAAWPSRDDLARLETTKEHHGATASVLCEWKKGERLAAYILRPGWRDLSPREAWERVDAAEFFSAPAAHRQAA